MLVVAALVLLFMSSEAWAQCIEMVRPVDARDYTGTSEDFANGFSTLYRGRYIDTPASYFEGVGSHPGVDITHDSEGNRFTTDTPVFAICEGVVKRVTRNGEEDGGWGNSLVIRHEVDGLSTILSAYAHLDRFTEDFAPEDTVTFGQQIGFVGSTGHSSGLHLHFQIDNDSQPRHPFFPNRFDLENDAELEVNTPDDDLLVADRTFSPLILVQQRVPPGPGPGPIIGDVSSIPMLSSGLSGVAVEADGTTALVAEGWGELSRVALATGQVIDSFFVSSAGIASPAIEAGGSSVLVITRPGAGIPTSGLARVDLETGDVEPIIEDGIDRGAALAIEPGGETALVTGAEGGLFRVNLGTGAISVVSGIGGLGLAIEPGGATTLVATGIFGAGTVSCDLMRVNLTDGSFETVAFISCNHRPVGVAIEPGGETALVTTNQRFAGSNSEVFRVNLDTGAVSFLATCPRCSNPQIVIEPFGTTALFLGNGNDTLIRFNRSTFEQDVLARSETPLDMALSSDGVSAYTISDGSGFVGGQLSRVDLDTGIVTAPIATTANLFGVALNTDETFAFVAANAFVGFVVTGFVQKISLASGNIDSVATFAPRARGLAIEGSGNTALVAVKDRINPEGSLLRVNLTSGDTTLITDNLLGPVAVTIEEEGVSALVAEVENNGTLSRVDLGSGDVTEIATGLGPIAGGGVVALEPGGESALVGGSSLSRVNVMTGAVTTLVPGFCGRGPLTALTGIVLEGGGDTALVSNPACGILRVQVR